MKIIATFANRKDSPEDASLVCAWDEYDIDSNPEGWREEKERSLASWGDELLHHVDVEILVPMDEVNRHLKGLVKTTAVATTVVQS